MKVWVIQEVPVDPEEGPLYWHNEDGWTDDLEYADTWSAEEKLYNNLPVGGIWVEKNEITQASIDKWKKSGLL